MPLPNIQGTFHPDYLQWNMDWAKYRLTYEGGSPFIQRYLQKYSEKETDAELKRRKEMAHCPAFSKAAINEIKNSIYQRFDDIKRIGGSPAYKEAVQGYNGGIDNCGNSMNSFMGDQVLKELAIIGKVGIYVDMPPKRGEALSDNLGLRPYVYLYRAEDIMNWIYDRTNNLQSVLLREYTYKYDEDTNFPISYIQQYRHLMKTPEGVFATIYSDSGEEQQVFKLNLTRIPFIMGGITGSLMTDIADYQITLLNMESSDVNFILRANFPFYVEQFSPQADILAHMKKNVQTADGGQANTEVSGDVQTEIGLNTGRRYPAGLDAPSFIHPSAEPLTASMAKQAQMKADIKLLLNLSIQNLTPTRSSAESKAKDETPLENGLSYIGLELQHIERMIAEIWCEYEGTKEQVTIHYPSNYSLKTEDQVRKEAEDLKNLLPVLPSMTYQKEIGKRIATVLLGNKTSSDSLDKIHKEIDEAVTMNSDPDVITQDIENGLVGVDLASQMRGYPKGEAEQAAEDHAQKLYRISLYQSAGGVNGAARGTPDATDPKGGKQEKKDSQQTPDSINPKDNTRGERK